MRQILLGLAVFCSLNAYAEAPNCYADNQQLDRLVRQDLSQSFHWQSFLTSHNSSGSFLTRARIQLFTESQSSEHWQATLRLDHVYQGQIGLAYNFYGVAVAVPGADANYTYFFDLTQNCTEPGISLFPSSEYYYDLPGFKLPRLHNDPMRELRIQVWGKM